MPKIAYLYNHPHQYVLSEGRIVLPRKRKHFRDISSESQNIIKEKLRQKIYSDLGLIQELADHGVKVESITLINIETNDTTSKETNFKLIYKNKSSRKEDEDMKSLARLCLRVKDLCQISDRRWTLLVKLIEPYFVLSSIHFLRVERDILKAYFLPQAYQNEFGYYFNAEEKILFHLNKNYNRFDCKKEVLRIFLAGDKTNVCRLQSFFIFWFSFIDEFDRAKSASETYTLGIFDIKKDDYDGLKKALKEIVEMFRELKTIEIDSRILDTETETPKILKLPTEYHLGGDHAFINAERGLLSCSSNHPCFSCITHKSDFYKDDLLLDKTTKRSLEMAKNYIDPNSQNKKIQKAQSCCKKPCKKGFLSTPIFDFIDFTNVHHDPLHEKIRIPNSILGLIAFEVSKYDLKNSMSLEELPNQNAFFKWLETIGIQRPYATKNEKSKASDPNFKIRDFTGSENDKICYSINANAFPAINNGGKYAKLLNDYYRLSKGYRSKFYLNKTDLLQTRITNWHHDFNSLFHNDKNTVYIHRFTNHLAKDIENFGNIDVFNCEGLEKGNDLTTKEFFASTNKKRDYIEQLILAKARQEYYRNNPADIITKVYKKIRNKKLEREYFFKDKDLFLIDVNKIESFLKEEIETCDLVNQIETELSEAQELRDNAYINEYLNQEIIPEETSYESPTNVVFGTLNSEDNHSINNQMPQSSFTTLLNSTEERNSNEPCLKRKNFLRKGLKDIFKRKK